MVKTKNYFEGIGRRKTAVARVRITPAKDTNVTVNDKVFDNIILYFQT
jgi:ribosomal protein S9